MSVYSSVFQWITKRCSAIQCVSASDIRFSSGLFLHVCSVSACQHSSLSLYVWELFRSGFQTKNRKNVHFLVCFAVFRSFRTISIETETKRGLYYSSIPGNRNHGFWPSQPVSKPYFWACIEFLYSLLIYLGVHPNFSLQFLFASFYFPGYYCSHIWICYHLWAKCDQICFAKKTREKQSVWPRSQIQNCDIL